MTYAIIPADKFNDMCEKVANMESMLIALTTPTQSEPDPNELWSSREIARASGYAKNYILAKMHEIEKERGVTLQMKKNCLAIQYKHIAEMKLKNFNPNK